MESTNLSETERAGDVYVVSAETSIDLVKIEPADEHDEDVVIEDDDTTSAQTTSVFDKTMYTYTQFNETSVSSTTNFVPAMPSIGTERPETELQLKFVNELGEKVMKINLWKLWRTVLDTSLVLITFFLF